MVGYKCFWCGAENDAQTKILGNSSLHTFGIGDEFYIGKEEEFYNCVINLKNKCSRCGNYTAIVIKDGKFVGVEDPKYATIIEGYFGSYEVCDNLQKVMKEKLKKIETEKK